MSLIDLFGGSRMSNKELLFITGLFPKEIEQNIREYSKGNIQNAANVLQWNIVDGLNNNFTGEMYVLNSMYIGAFPVSFKKLFIKTHNFQLGNEKYGKNIGFMNLIFFKHFMRYVSLKKHVKNWVLSSTNNDKVVIAYAMTNVNVWLFKFIKRLNPTIDTCIIVPDLPEFMNNNNKNILYRLSKKISMNNIYKESKYIDKCVYISKYMREKFPNKPYIVMEGIATIDQDNIVISSEASNLKIILYTGTLDEKYGIINLLRAFSEIKNSNYRLVICGDGDAKEAITKASNEDNRIIFKGLIPREEVLILQKKATVLINPRMNNEKFCKYSFPSKMLEYLSSGVPVIAYKLSGIPDEYDDFIYYIAGNTIEDMTNKIIEICEKDPVELAQFSKKAFDFVRINKNKDLQCKKIISFIYTNR